MKTRDFIFCCLSQPTCLNWQTLVGIQMKRFDSLLSFARVFLWHWKCGQLIWSVYRHTDMFSAYNSTRKKRKGLLCCLLALLRKSWMKCWMSEFFKLVLPFLQNRRASLRERFLLNSDSSESVRHVQVLFLWNSRVASDTLNVFVSWQLHNISWRHVVVD